MRKFRLSYSTVSHALDQLERDGLIARKQGKGTFVQEHFEPAGRAVTPIQHRVIEVYYQPPRFEFDYVPPDAIFLALQPSVPHPMECKLNPYPADSTALYESVLRPHIAVQIFYDPPSSLAEFIADASAVHPESYEIVDAMARDLCCSVRDLMGDEALRRRIDLKRYVTERAGMPTLEDIMNELARPGRDPRKRFETFSFADGVNEPKDLKPGMKLPGVVTNVTRFGAFVDVGVHQDGLVHVSQLADRFVKDPMDIVKVGQRVFVTVVEVDLARNRISLSMKRNPSPTPQKDRARN